MALFVRHAVDEYFRQSLRIAARVRIFRDSDDGVDVDLIGHEIIVSARSVFSRKQIVRVYFESDEKI